MRRPATLQNTRAPRRVSLGDRHDELRKAHVHLTEPELLGLFQPPPGLVDQLVSLT